jgi:hypothetical protein
MYRHDIFISYAAADAQRFGDEHTWIERFYDDLKACLTLRSGEE